LYPSAEVADIEFTTKWAPEFMPRGNMRNSPVYGWRIKRDKGYIKQIEFASGVTVVFKFHSQKAVVLQTASVDAVFADEELPVKIYDEIMFRLAATRGYFHMVFTATLGQDLWRRAMEPGNPSEEAFPDAFKRCVSMYDCLFYKDGTPSHWTPEYIENEIIPKCKSEAEVQKRVYGRFVLDSSMSYYGFNPEKNIGPPLSTPKPSWGVYAGVDPGSGGVAAHPAAIIFLAVSPDNKKGIVFKGWRGDGIETTSGDVFEKYNVMARGLTVIDKRYDYSAKDFGLIAERAGITFNKANKSRLEGEELLNTLFRNGMLEISGGDVELQKLITELMTLRKGSDKSKARDDFIDALRYVVMAIAWDWEALNKPQKDEDLPEVKTKYLTEAEYMADEIARRRGRFVDENKKPADAFVQLEWSDEQDEIDFWNAEYGG
jgi:hypothetical protein